MNTSIYFLLPVIFLGGIVSTVAGGGLSIILIVFGSLFIDIRMTIVVNAYMLLINQSMKALHFGSFARRDVVLWSVLLGIPSTYLGGYLLFIVPKQSVQVLVAVLAITFILLRHMDLLPQIHPTRMVLLLLGAVSGFLGGLAGNGALIRKPVFLHMGLTKEVFLGTTSLLSLILSVPKLAAYIPRTSWNDSYTIVVVLSIPLLFLSVRVGRRMLHSMEPKIFEILLQSVIFIGAIRLLYTAFA